MAVYTQVTSCQLREFMRSYDLGEIVSCVGIEQGIDNSNYALETSSGKFILTLYEGRMVAEELPFFLGLMQHLNSMGMSCPTPVINCQGEVLGALAGRPTAILTFLKGAQAKPIRKEHCRQVGAALAFLHLAGRQFRAKRKNDLSVEDWVSIKASIEKDLHFFGRELGTELDSELNNLCKDWPIDLPCGVIHGDLFPDNVFFEKGLITGIIDFYFACFDSYAYDISVCLNAWCFDRQQSFNYEYARALIQGYESHRKLSDSEVKAMPILSRGSAMRFLLTRLYDWFSGPEGALVRQKDPLEYLNKLRFHKSIEDPGQYGLNG